LFWENQIVLEVRESSHQLCLQSEKHVDPRWWPSVPTVPGLVGLAGLRWSRPSWPGTRGVPGPPALQENGHDQEVPQHLPSAAWPSLGGIQGRGAITASIHLQQLSLGSSKGLTSLLPKTSPF